MIPHYIVMGSLVLGLPQGVYCAVQITRALEVGRPLEVILILTGAFLGIFLGYFEIAIIRKIWPWK
jgi:hypothetical protein